MDCYACFTDVLIAFAFGALCACVLVWGYMMSHPEGR